MSKRLEAGFKTAGSFGHVSEADRANRKKKKLSLRRPCAFYSTSFSAAGEVCEWAAALSPSSVCSGVSRSQEVIEFPLLKISIIGLAGNLPGMKWTAGVCVCVNGGSRKGGRAGRGQL